MSVQEDVPFFIDASVPSRSRISSLPPMNTLLRHRQIGWLRSRLPPVKSMMSSYPVVLPKKQSRTIPRPSDRMPPLPWSNSNGAVEVGKWQAGDQEMSCYPATRNGAWSFRTWCGRGSKPPATSIDGVAVPFEQSVRDAGFRRADGPVNGQPTPGHTRSAGPAKNGWGRKQSLQRGFAPHWRLPGLLREAK